MIIHYMKKKGGCPLRYSEKVAAEICSRLANGETLNQICRDDHLPARSTVLDWVLQNREGFSDRYARARDLLVEHWADEVVEISDDGKNDWVERESKGSSTYESLNSEHVQRSRLRVDTRKWLLSRLKPDKYGDRTQLTGKDEKPLFPDKIEVEIIKPKGRDE